MINVRHSLKQSVEKNFLWWKRFDFMKQELFKIDSNERIWDPIHANRPTF